MKKQPALPSCASVFGTSTFPAIDNQGGIGSCASQSITRNQFTNAYARYIQSIEEGSAYCPRDNGALPFTPKFTFNFSGAGTVWVYDILKEQGCLRQADAPFHKNEDGGSVIKDKDGNLYTDTSSWCVKEGEMEKALSARIRNFKQVWFTKEPYSEKLTTSEAGQKLIVSIKEAIVRGDAVVTGGYPARWVFGQLDGCGTLGGVGEAAVVAAAGNAGGGHQVTLVGYDDNVTATFGGVRLKGAFQIAELLRRRLAEQRIDLAHVRRCQHRFRLSGIEQQCALFRTHVSDSQPEYVDVPLQPCPGKSGARFRGRRNF